MRRLESPHFAGVLLASRLEEVSFEDHPSPEDSAAPRFRATYSLKKL
jgi:hypothetical protein